MYKAANTLSGFKRLLPQCRRYLEVSGLFYKNWARATPRTRALPLKGERVKAFCSFASASKRPNVGILVVLGFLGLLRVNELTSLQFSQLTFVNSELCYIVLVDSKGAKLSGNPENVATNDICVIAILKAWAGSAKMYDLVFPVSYVSV